MVNDVQEKVSIMWSGFRYKNFYPRFGLAGRSLGKPRKRPRQSKTRVEIFISETGPHKRYL